MIPQVLVNILVVAAGCFLSQFLWSVVGGLCRGCQKK